MGAAKSDCRFGFYIKNYVNYKNNSINETKPKSAYIMYLSQELKLGLCSKLPMKPVHTTTEFTLHCYL